jgi:hypothetical protein
MPTHDLIENRAEKLVAQIAPRRLAPPALEGLD